MENSKIRQWVEEKLETGVKPEKVRSALDDHGYDPSIVDEFTGEDENGTGKPLKIPEESSREESEKEEVESKAEDENIENDEEKEINPVDKSADQETGDRVEDTDEGGNVQKLKPPVDETKKIADSLEESVKSRGKTGLGAAALIILILLGTVYLPTMNIPDFEVEDRDNPSESVNTSQKVALPSGFSGERVVLEEGTAQPSRASISSGGKIGFVNRNPYTLEISFDAQKGNITVEPMDYSVTSFSSITYYTGFPDGDEKIVKGSVYVR